MVAMLSVDSSNVISSYVCRLDTYPSINDNSHKTQQNINIHQQRKWSGHLSQSYVMSGCGIYTCTLPVCRNSAAGFGGTQKCLWILETASKL